MEQREERASGRHNRSFSVIPLVIAVLAASSARASDASFTLEALSPHPYTPAYLGNGLIGLATTPLGTAPGRCFVAGLYDHTQGDVPRLASLPAWNEIDIFNGTHWLNSNAALSGLTDYHQTLDMYDGVLRTSYVWLADGRSLHVQAEEFVSRDRTSVAAMRVVITPGTPGPIKIKLPVRNWAPPHRYLLEQVQKLDLGAAQDPWKVWYPGHLDVSDASVDQSSGGVLLSLVATAPGNGPAKGVAVAAEWNVRAAVETHREADGAYALVSVNAKPGIAYTFTKFFALAR